MFTISHNLTTVEVLNLPLTARSRYLRNLLDHSPGKYYELRADMARLRSLHENPTKEKLERARARRKERDRQEQRRNNDIEDLALLIDPVELSPTEKELLSEIKDQPNLYMSTPLGTFRVRSTELYDLNKQRTNIEADIGHQLHTKVSIIPGEDTQQDVDAVIGIDILTIYSEIRLNSSFS